MKTKKNYITPQIAVFTCNSESLLAGFSEGNAINYDGNNPANLDFYNETKYGGSSELSKDNSGMSGMSWDEEE